jgi:thiosulfate/3-mercaptopyruvate sulfurtransferase
VVKGPLISVAALAESSTDPSRLDVRWSLGGPSGREEYDKGHLPGAVFVDLDTELAASPGPGGRHPLPSAADFQAAMRRAGVNNESPVVVYDGATSMAAARAWWLLRYFGHPDVRVLDGGLAAWAAAGHPISTETPAIEPGNFVARAGGMPVLGPEEVASVADHGVLIDARSPERFRGESEPIDHLAGHIPRARNLPTTNSLEASSSFRDPAALQRYFEEAGVTAELAVGVYCGSGISAAHEILALELAGIRAALFPGSWSEWITDPRRPIAQGP